MQELFFCVQNWGLAWLLQMRGHFSASRISLNTPLTVTAWKINKDKLDKSKSPS